MLIAGCGDKGPETIRVRGTVNFEGRERPEICRIFFQPNDVAEGVPLRPAIAEVDENGKFAVTSFSEGDGLVPGEYSVKITYFDVKPGGNRGSENGWLERIFKPEDLVIKSGTRGVVEVSYDVKPPR